MLQRGHICVYTGNGKGKTTAALGRGLAAVSQGSRVYMVQFLKRPQTSGEHFVPESVASLFTIIPAGRGGFIGYRECEPEDRYAGRFALSQAREAMFSGAYGMIILDEAMAAVRKEVIELQQLLDFISDKPESIELIITGREAPSEVIGVADVVIEMKKIKHHFDKGLRATKGIDY